MIKILLFSLIIVVLQACAGGNKGAGSDSILDREVVSIDIQSDSENTDKQTSATEEGIPDVTRVFYFTFDRAILDKISQESLKQHAAYIIETEVSVIVEGHTDERGTREYNISLGEQRAYSVRDFLLLNGVPAEKITVVSFGEEKLLNFSNDESASAQNRRAVLQYNF